MGESMLGLMEFEWEHSLLNLHLASYTVSYDSFLASRVCSLVFLSDFSIILFP